MQRKRSSPSTEKEGEANRLRPRLAPTLAMTSLALLAAACGSASPTSSSTASGSPRTFAASAYKYSSCMRTHGVPDFPDPRVSTGDGHVSIAVRVTPTLTSSPRFNSAQTACRGILPMPSPGQIAQQQHAEERGKLSFAKCVRSHGITNFPDPTSQGQISRQMVTAAGVDLHAPGVLAAAKACVPASRGTISAADVDQAVNSTP
jgi:hypothetical protein